MPLHVNVVSPEREIFSGPAEMVVAKGVAGDVGILPQHAPMLIQLAIHPVRVIEEIESRRQRVFLVDGGFLHVTPGEEETRVDVLAEGAVLPGEVDVAAERARAEELRRQVEQEGQAEVETDLARALMRAEFGEG